MQYLNSALEGANLSGSDPQHNDLEAFAVSKPDLITSLPRSPPFLLPRSRWQSNNSCSAASSRISRAGARWLSVNMTRRGRR